MYRLRIILLSISLVFTWSSFLSARPYKARFLSEPVIMPAEDGMSNLFAWVEFGPIVNQWDYETYCSPPPPFFVVVVDWLSPDDPTCWINVFMGIQAVCVGIRGGVIIRGQGHIWLDNSALPWNGWCITYPLICGMNHFRLEIGPLFPSGEGLPDGTYRISLISFNYFLWPKACDPKRRAWENWVYNLYLTDSRKFQIIGDIGDHSLETGLHYFGVARNDSIYNGGNLHVFSDYRLKCKVFSSKSEALMPETLIGELVPEGRRGTSIILQRSPEEDEVSCDPDYPLRYFAYTSEDLIKPVDLWPGYNDWNLTAKQLSCNFGAEENDLDLPASIVVYVLANLNLDRLNDSTECFIPVNGETMDFEFRFSEDLHLDDNSYIGFIVRNGNYDWVYKTPLIFGDAHEEPGGNDWGIPDPPQMYTIPVSWDGRNNQDLLDPGHFVDPDLGPYQAYVYITDDDGEIMSNIEGFNVVPMIDSVLVTHTPWYPPPPLETDIQIYSLAKGKIDDSGNPAVDYRYYIPEGENYPFGLGFWDGQTNRFWDLSPNNWGVVEYYKYLDNWEPSPVLPWNNENWGSLSYKWYRIDDYALQGGEDDTWWQQLYYENVDFTQSWGDTWNIIINNGPEWWIPWDQMKMRFFVRSEIINTKNNIIIQQNISAPDSSHLIITGPVKPFEYYDIVDWAITELGTPYYTFARPPWPYKTPYTIVDCSGLVIGARIQDIGSLENSWYRLNNITVQHLVDGQYNYPWPDGPLVSTQTSPILPSDANRTDLIAFRLNENYKWGHIGIIEKYRYDYDNNQISRCFVIHAVGKSTAGNRRVRRDSIFRWYSGWDYNFLRFTE